MSKYAGKKINANEYNGVRSNLGYASKNHVDNMWNELTFYRQRESLSNEPWTRGFRYEDNELVLYVDDVKYVRADSIENAPRGSVVAAYEDDKLASAIDMAHELDTARMPSYATAMRQLWAEVQHYRSQIEHANDPYEGGTPDEPDDELCVKECFDKYNKAIEGLNDIVNELKARKAEDAGMIQAIREFNGNIEQRVSAAHQDLSVAAERIANLEAIVNGLVARSENVADRIEKIESNTHVIYKTGDFTVMPVADTRTPGSCDNPNCATCEPAPEKIVKLVAGMKIQGPELNDSGARTTYTLVKSHIPDTWALVSENGNYCFDAEYTEANISQYLSAGIWKIVK